MQLIAVSIDLSSNNCTSVKIVSQQRPSAGHSQMIICFPFIKQLKHSNSYTHQSQLKVNNVRTGWNPWKQLSKSPATRMLHYTFSRNPSSICTSKAMWKLFPTRLNMRRDMRMQLRQRTSSNLLGVSTVSNTNLIYFGGRETPASVAVCL